MIKPRLSRPPSPYNVFLFHAVRAFQAVAAAIVLAVMSFSVHWLIADGYPVPWTFLVLLSVSALAVPTLVVTAYMHYVRTLRPLYSAYANGALAVLWALGLALLSWNLAALLGARCDKDHWDHAMGVSVCRLFKALESFAVVGTAATAAAFALDLYTHRASTRLGAYNPMGDTQPRRRDAKRPLSPPTTARAPSRDPSRSRGALEMPAETHEPTQPYRAGPRPLGVQSFAYEAPSEQTRYDGPGAKWD